MTNRFDEALEEFERSYFRNSGGQVRPGHVLYESADTIREALRLASRITENPYTETTQEPFESGLSKTFDNIQYKGIASTIPNGMSMYDKPIDWLDRYKPVDSTKDL